MIAPAFISITAATGLDAEHDLTNAGRSAFAALIHLASRDERTLTGLCELVDAIRDRERHATTEQIGEHVRELVAAVSGYRVAPTAPNDHRLATARRRALDAIGGERPTAHSTREVDR